MAFKQPRVPPLREEERLAGYLRELILFLKDFCLEAWMDSRKKDAQMQAMKEEIRALKARIDGE